MNESEFINLLQKRAKEQEMILSRVPFSGVFLHVSRWLGKHPWRLLVPLAFFVSLILRAFIGSSYTDSILQIFRGI